MPEGIEHLSDQPESEKQATIWDYYKPRHTHAWNMLVLSWRALEGTSDQELEGFEDEYLWENFIIRLWLYRTTVRTLTRLHVVSTEANEIVARFDGCFETDGRNGLKAVRDMIEHFDDYAAGVGRGPAERERDLDPWRTVSRDRYERGRYLIERAPAYAAAINLRSDAKQVSDKFIAWYKSSLRSEI